ncbi:fibronectin type III domain-containing protein [Cellulomonas dongxiuzhuiae]|uniref:fibronectin type III domain-containing protein n=1 Tax=Cellulomonas dongxiuzhuiae TaxID=2819979 RepID=UPI001AAF7FB3|nr:fibronectin type III domain-containing protein [Cellulomonas dongxiuzhuiae]MBO3089618.1 fibronectin type III domain-containing protein [Cellulomonas dongxiuzhuiae]
MLLAAVLLLVGLTPAHAAAGDGSSFDSPLAVPLTTLDGTFAATNEGRSTPGGNYPGRPIWANGTWYEFTAPADARISIALSSSFDNALELWTASGTLVDSNDDADGTLNARITVDVTAGTTYRFAFASVSFNPRTGPGTVTIRPVDAPAAPTGVTVTPGDRSVTVTWTPPASVVSSSTLVCSVDGGTATYCGTVSGAGTSATVDGLTNGVPVTVQVHNQSTAGVSLLSPGVVATPRAMTSLVVTTVPAVVVTGAPYAVVASVERSDSAPATGDVTFDIGGATSTVALVDGEATVTGLVSLAGTVPVTVTYAATPDQTGGSATTEVVVGRATQTVTLDAVGPLTYGDAPVTLTATATSGGPVTFGATGACTVVGATLQVDGAGDCAVTASQAGTTEHLPAEASTTVTVGQLVQTLTLAVPGLVHGQTADVVTSSSAGLPVTLTATGACTVTDGRVTATDVGTCTVTATQDGDANVLPAPPVSVEVDVERRSQTVTIDPIGDLLFAVEPVRVVATSSLGLPVTLTATGACLVVGDELRTVASGDCTITATQAGDAHTLPADATTTIRVVGTGTSATVRLDAEVGDRAAGAPFTARASGVLPGSDVVVTVHSTPRELARVAVGADGTAVVTGVLPADLAAGDYRLVADAVGLDGVAVAAEVRFTIAADGVLVRIGDSVLTRAPAAGAAPAVAPAAAALAVTGPGDSLAVGALAGLWLLLGAALVAWRRRATV